MKPYEGAYNGLIMISDHEDATRYEGALFGFANIQGDAVIAPQFIAAQHFSDGLAAVQFREGDWGYIDSTGLILERGLTDEPQNTEYGL